MAIKHLVTHTKTDPGETGSFNPAKLAGLFVTFLVVPVAFSFFGILLPPLPVPLTVTGWIMATFAMPVMGSGFYHGMGKGVFKKLAEAYINKASK